MENLNSMEQTSMREQSSTVLYVKAVTEPLEGGKGSIRAVNPVRGEAAQHLAEEIAGCAQEIYPDAPAGCIDGRVALMMLNGAEVLPGPKSAGGNAVCTFAALELTGYFQDGKSVQHHFARTVQLLEQAKQPVGFHTDDKKAPILKDLISRVRGIVAEKSIDDAVSYIAESDLQTAFGTEMTGTGCAANDDVAPICSVLAQAVQPNSEGVLESAADVALRLEHVRKVAEAVKGEVIDDDDYKTVVNGATALASQLNSWNSLKALLIADKVLLANSVEDGVLSRIQVLEDDGAGVHGHTEDAIVVVRDKKVTLETSRVYQATGHKAFIANTSAAEVAGSIFGEGVADAIYLYHAAAQVHLTDGSQPAIVLSQ